jgi:4'-phosphopantetheinyl transferase
VSLLVVGAALAACRPGRLAALLDDDERAAAAAMTCPERHDSFVAGHALLRLVLSADDPSRAPPEWRIGRTATGRPVVDGGPGVSLSHGGGVVVVALAHGRAVGVDVEPLVAVPVLDEVLTRTERRRLRAAPDGERAALFLRTWTLKEAALKCAGTGLPGGPERVRTTLDPPGVAGPAVAEALRGPSCAQWLWARAGRSYVVSAVTAQSSRVLPSATTRSHRCP